MHNKASAQPQTEGSSQSHRLNSNIITTDLINQLLYRQMSVEIQQLHKKLCALLYNTQILKSLHRLTVNQIPRYIVFFLTQTISTLVILLISTLFFYSVTAALRRDKSAYHSKYEDSVL